MPDLTTTTTDLVFVVELAMTYDAAAGARDPLTFHCDAMGPLLSLRRQKIRLRLRRTVTGGRPERLHALVQDHHKRGVPFLAVAEWFAPSYSHGSLAFNVGSGADVEMFDVENPDITPSMMRADASQVLTPIPSGRQEQQPVSKPTKTRDGVVDKPNAKQASDRPKSAADQIDEMGWPT